MEMMKAIGEGKHKGALHHGREPAAHRPGRQPRCKEALQHLDLLVVQDIFLTETAELAHVVLPGVSFAEKDGTFTNTERRVQRVRKAIKPVGRGAARLADHLRSLGPAGLSHGLCSRPRRSWRRSRQLTPSYARHHLRPHRQVGSPVALPERTTIRARRTSTRDSSRGARGKFHVTPYVPAPELPDEEYPFCLTTGRVLYHYHAVLSRKSKPLSDMAPEPIIEVSREDARKIGFNGEGARVVVESRRGRIEAQARVVDHLQEGARLHDVPLSRRPRSTS